MNIGPLSKTKTILIHFSIALEGIQEYLTNEQQKNDCLKVESIHVHTFYKVFPKKSIFKFYQRGKEGDSILEKLFSTIELSLTYGLCTIFYISQGLNTW